MYASQITVFIFAIVPLCAAQSGTDGPIAAGGGGGLLGLCNRVVCGSGQRCREDWSTQQAVCEPIPTDNGGSCNCRILESIPNRDRNTLSFSGDDCHQTVKCTRTYSQSYVYLGFYNFGTESTRTPDFPNFATLDVFCSTSDKWTANGQPFDEFDC